MKPYLLGTIFDLGLYRSLKVMTKRSLEALNSPPETFV